MTDHIYADPCRECKQPPTLRITKTGMYTAKCDACPDGDEIMASSRELVIERWNKAQRGEKI